MIRIVEKQELKESTFIQKTLHSILVDLCKTKRQITYSINSSKLKIPNCKTIIFYSDEGIRIGIPSRSSSSSDKHILITSDGTVRVIQEIPDKAPIILLTFVVDSFNVGGGTLSLTGRDKSYLTIWF